MTVISKKVGNPKISQRKNNCSNLFVASAVSRIIQRRAHFLNFNHLERLYKHVVSSLCAICTYRTVIDDVPPVVTWLPRNVTDSEPYMALNWFKQIQLLTERWSTQIETEEIKPAK